MAAPGQGRPAREPRRLGPAKGSPAKRPIADIACDIKTKKRRHRFYCHLPTMLGSLLFFKPNQGHAVGSQVAIQDAASGKNRPVTCAYKPFIAQGRQCHVAQFSGGMVTGSKAMAYTPRNKATRRCVAVCRV